MKHITWLLFDSGWGFLVWMLLLALAAAFGWTAGYEIGMGQ